MKISQLLEDTREEVFEKLLKSKYYQLNIRPTIRLHKDKTPELAWNSVYHGNSILYHGTSGDGLQQYTFRYRTGSRDTNLYTHSLVNRLTQEKFGEPIRNLMFTSTSEIIANSYGTAMVMLPSGDYKLYFNKNVKDFTVHFKAASEQSDISEDSTVTYFMNEVQEGGYEENYEEYFSEFSEEESESESDKNYTHIFNKSFFYLGHMVFEKNATATIDGLKDYMKNMIEHDDLKVDISVEKLHDMSVFLFDIFIKLRNAYDDTLKNYVNSIEELHSSHVNIEDSEVMCHPGKFVLMPISVFREFVHYAHANDQKI